MLRLIPAPAPVHFTNLERGGSALPEKMNLLTTALLISQMSINESLSHIFLRL